MKTLRWATFLLLLASGFSFAQSKKVPVAVTHSGDDSVGEGIAFALKEAVRGSQSFRLVDDEVAPKQPRIVVHMVSIDTDEYPRQRGLSSSIATVIVFDSIETPGFGIYLTMLVQYCGRDKIDPCAKTILPKIDREIEKLRTSWPALWKKL